ncbi:MAG: hypothetical protein D3907_02825 [Candidatus Electrothrix sp. AUS3]|nr:hypothetical protein [Candidatus Electrothrix gigas]
MIFLLPGITTFYSSLFGTLWEGITKFFQSNMLCTSLLL